MDAIADLARRPAAAALFLDIDGVLAPIVPRPEDAAMPPATRAEVERLVGRYALVACVTGRPTADARAIVDVSGVVFAGEHGLELEPEADAWGVQINAFADLGALPDHLRPDLQLERKEHSVSYHYRGAPDQAAVRAALETVADRARAEGFVARFGRRVLELLPPIPASKGTAVTHLLAAHDLRRALYAGDDTTDLDAFAALDGLELAVRVAVASAEGPAALREQADIVVASPEELTELLRRL